jgi:hypothetical protein
MAVILHNNWVDTAYDKRTFGVVEKTVHMMIVYDALVKYSVTDAQFVKCVIDFYSFMKWKKYKTNYELLSKMNTESLFSLVKAESVDWCLTQFLQMCEVRESRSFTKEQKKAMFAKIGDRCAFGLDTNIYEAVFGDKVIKYRLQCEQRDCRDKRASPATVRSPFAGERCDGIQRYDPNVYVAIYVLEFVFYL